MQNDILSKPLDKDLNDLLVLTEMLDKLSPLALQEILAKYQVSNPKSEEIIIYEKKKK
jgi:hypothetical protein